MFFHFFPKSRKSLEKMIHRKKNWGHGTSKIVKSRQSSRNGHLPYRLFILLLSVCAHVWRRMWICLRSKDAHKLIAWMSLSLFATFQDRRSQKNRLNDKLMWCLVVLWHDFHGQCPDQVEEKLFQKHILCLKRRCLCLRPLTQNRTKQILRCITKKLINFNCAVIETSVSIEPSNNALELNAIAYTFSKIFQPELKQFLRQMWTPCLHVFGFLSEMNKETEKKKKKQFLCCERCNSLLVAYRNTKTCREGETRQTKSTMKQDFSWEALPKQNIKAWLASLKLSRDLSRHQLSGPPYLHLAHSWLFWKVWWCKWNLVLLTTLNIWKAVFKMTEKQYLQWKPHLNQIKWPRIAGN